MHNIRHNVFLFGLICMTAAFSYCAPGVPESQDPEAMRAVKIGQTTWTASNLDVAVFRNGDEIPQARSRAEFEQMGNSQQPAWCYPDFDEAKGAQHGKMYNWYAVSDPRGLAPEGWRVPTDNDWSALAKSVGGDVMGGVKLKAASGWVGNGSGDNASGFNALATGGMSALNGFSGEGRVAVFWSETPSGDSFAYYRVLHATRPGIFREDDLKITGMSVRLIKVE